MSLQLDPDAPISQKALAARLHCNPSTVVDPTDRLESSGLVVRQAHPTDRRVNVLLVTPRGREVREQLVARLFEPPDAFNRLTATDQLRFRDAMLEALAAASAEPEGRSEAGDRPMAAAPPSS